MRENVLKPLLVELQDKMRGGQGGLQARLGILGFVGDRLYRGVKRLDRGMVNTYQLEDQVFRMATFIRRRSQGVPADVAALQARDQFLNYDIRAPWINAARSTLLPFISYTYRAAPMIAKTLAERPWKIAKYIAVYQAMNMLAYTLAPSEYDEEEERASFSDDEQGFTWVGSERLVRMPWLSNDNPVFLDVRRWIPAGDIFDASGSDIPAWLQIGGPIVTAFELYLNKTAFFQNEIINDITDTDAEKLRKRALYAYQSWLPSAPWIPRSWYWDKISRANRGQLQAFSNEPYSKTEAWLSSVGLKVKPKDIDTGYAIWDWRMDTIKRELGFEKSALKKGLKRKAITREQYETQLSVIDGKLQRVEERRDEIFSHRDD